MNRPNQADVDALVAQLSSGQFEAAVAAARRLTEAFPHIPLLHLLLATGLTQGGQLELAVQTYREALALDPDYFDAFYNLGVVFRRQGRMSEAIESYLSALKLQPQNLDARRNLARIYDEFAAKRYHQVRLADAAEFSAKALALDGENLELLGIAARIARALGRADGEILKRMVAAPVRNWGDVTRRIWAGSMLGRPEEVYSFRIDGLARAAGRRAWDISTGAKAATGIREWLKPT
ncbi:MAG: tetratricopeptide repeat protein [Rhodospirillaceae bacterium]|nr:tetratricopeptide repeat protein [Rhodospirillaceae bacterium]